VLLTTRTADWFAQRDFALAGPAWSSELLPPERRGAVNPARNSQLYYKDLLPLSDDEREIQPGRRIGF
jgi:amino-acid N-acetyltransferase